MALREKEICRAVLSPRRELVIAGAYGCCNRGDELMLENLLRDGRAAAPECAVTVLSHRPKETARRFDVDSLYYLNVPGDPPKNEERPARSSSGGGNLLQDATSRRSLVYYLVLLRKGKQSGCRTLLHGAGLGRSRRALGQMHGGAERMRRYDRLSGEGKPCLGKEARHKRSGAHSRRRTARQKHPCPPRRGRTSFSSVPGGAAARRRFRRNMPAPPRRSPQSAAGSCGISP